MKIELLNKKTLHLSDGNQKLGNIPNFNLPPIRTCSAEACKSCGKDCYAMKSYRLWPSVKTAYDENLEIILNDLAGFTAGMEKLLNHPNAPRFFRVHSSGDFVNKEYAQAWYNIIKSHPGTSFLIFTKQYEHIRGINFYELKNCRLYLSDWPGTAMPSDLAELYHIAFLDDGTRPAEFFGDALECPGNCSECFGCWLADGNIKFKKH